MHAPFDVDKGESAAGLKYWGACAGKATLLEEDYSPKFSHGLSSSSRSNFEIPLDFLGGEERDTASMQRKGGSTDREDQSGAPLGRSLLAESDVHLMNLDWDVPLLTTNSHDNGDNKDCDDPILLNTFDNLPVDNTWPVNSYLKGSKGLPQDVDGASLPPRKPGRPKLYDVDASISEPLESTSSDLKNQDKKRGRGPKPKYVYSTAQQAAAARRQRNRKAALQSYYKRREHVHTLETQVKELEEEQQHLMNLFKGIESGSIALEDASESGIDAWIAQK